MDKTEILLINPPSKSYRKPEEHLGLAYLAAILRAHNYQVNIIDSYLYGYNEKDTLARILAYKRVKIIGFTTYIDSYGSFSALVKKIKINKPNVKIVAGGHLATFSYDEILKDIPVDIVVRGEGEITFLELVEKVLSDKSWMNIKGTALIHNGKIKLNKARELISDLDTLPIPVRDTLAEARNKKALCQISASRGCYGNCSFCSINSIYKISPHPCSGVFGGWRGRSSNSVLNEVELLNRKYNVNNFKFVDDCFFGPGGKWRESALEFARCIKEKEIHIKFRISTRVNNIEEPIIRSLKEAGLYAVSLGVESGNKNDLDIYNKGATVQQNIQALKILKKYKIKVMMGFIGFNPYSTLKSLTDNLFFLKSYAKDCITNKISLQLYVHADDQITKRLIVENVVDGRDFPNYTYKIIDRKARNVYGLLCFWNKFNEKIYNKTIDPLSAPRIISSKNEKRVHALIKKLRGYDLEAFEYILNAVRANKYITEQEFTKKFINKYISKWKKIETIINNIYEEENY